MNYIKKNLKQRAAVIFAILAASFYAISAPFSKILLDYVSPAMLAALLYLGAGVGMSFVALNQKKRNKNSKEKSLTRKDLPYTVAMVILDIAAPILLMMGLTLTTAANVSLLNNFEIVSTSIIALIVFKEAISKRLWISITLVTLASIILSVKDTGSFSQQMKQLMDSSYFSYGSVFVLAACICWGLENNCTRTLSNKNPMEIVMVKGFGSGLGSLLIAFAIGEKIPELKTLVFTMLLGFVAYGLSVFFYVHAQRELGAAKTSAYYAIAPFIGVAISLVIFKEVPSISFAIALLIMITGAYFASTDK